MKHNRTIVNDRSGDPVAILVTREEAGRWLDDSWLRSELHVIAKSLQAKTSTVMITTEGGFVVDVWNADSWQTA